MQASELAGGRRGALLAAGLAGAAALIFAAVFTWDWAWPLALLEPVPLALLALSRIRLRLVAAAVALAQMAQWLIVLRWMMAVTGPGFFFLCAYQSIFGVGFVWLLRVAGRSGAPATLLVPPIWIAFEFARGEVAFNGYPWYMLAQPLAHWPALVQSADLLGSYFAGTIAATVAGLATDLARVALFGARPRGLRSAITITIIIQAGNLLYGAIRLRQATGGERGPIVLAIQTNLPQDNKVMWLPAQQVQDMESFLELSRAAAESAALAGHYADVLVWPETMLPGMGLEPQALAFLKSRGIMEPVDFAEAIAGLPRTTGAVVLAGAPSYLGLGLEGDVWRWDEHYNSAYLVVGDPPYQRYDKVFLTPFGETMPYISNWPWLERKLLALGAAGMQFDLDAAKDVRLLNVPLRDGRMLLVGTPICFEDTSGWVCRRMVYDERGKRADLLINLSNDGWFGADDSSRRLQGQISRLRCIENRVPLARCANTGVSLAFDSCGRVLAPLASSAGSAYPGPRRPGWYAAELPLDGRSTLYGRVGDSWGWTLLLGAAGLAILGASTGTTRRGEP